MVSNIFPFCHDQLDILFINHTFRSWNPNIVILLMKTMEIISIASSNTFLFNHLCINLHPHCTLSKLLITRKIRQTNQLIKCWQNQNFYKTFFCLSSVMKHQLSLFVLWNAFFPDKLRREALIIPFLYFLWNTLFSLVSWVVKHCFFPKLTRCVSLAS